MARTKKVVSKRIRKQQLKECAKKMQELKKARKSLQNEQILPVKSISDLDAIPATNVKETNHLVLETWCNINKSSQLQDHEETHNVDKVSQSSEVIEQQLKQIKDVSNENTRKRKFTDVNNDNNIDKEKPESVNELWDLPCEVATQGQQIEKIKDGNHRIVDFKYFTEELMRISSHKSLFQCSFNTMELISETKKGLVSKFLYECLLCKTRFTIKNTPEDLNTKLIEGTMTAGCGNAQLERITASLDLPSISEHTYSACQNKICQAWETTAWDEMKTAGEREREAAINEGKVTKDGIALIDVIADGCWSKRSYKSNYAALSGAAAIVGRRFGQILFMSVKNKYCCICARSEKRNTTPRAHQCFKNYSGTSTAMESAILVEGFKQSVEMHNLIYARFIADGDSSTYAKILESRPYPDVTVEKINCRNHILRNFCNKLQQIKTDTKFNLNDRKKVTTAKILTARKYITDSITYHNKNRELDGIKSLHVDINQSMNHAFGKHGECNKNICSRENVSQECADFFNSYIFNKLRFITTNVSSHARSLIENVDSNVVERFNGVIAKFVGGKRINYSLKRSYQARCAGAVISFNTGKIHSAISKNIYKASPSRRLKTYEEKVDQRRRYHRTIKRRKNRALLPKKLDFNYGENVEAPDMDAETYQNCKTTFLKNLEKCDAERNEIQSRTILQSESGEWMELRRNLLTASNFGKIVKRKRTNSCANTVKNMLYKPDIGHVASINHGRTHEKVALEQLSKLLKVTIDPCGLYIDKTHPFLGATPDGIIENNTLVEIKCPVIPFKIGIEAAISQGKMHLWRINKKTGDIVINKMSDWYMQVQGQMHVCDVPKCILAVWYGVNQIKVEEIFKDDEFWTDKMEPKLISFYFDCLLPELVDPRHTRKLPIREPNYVNISKNKENLNDRESMTEEPINVISEIQFSQF